VTSLIARLLGEILALFWIAERDGQQRQIYKSSRSRVNPMLQESLR
jgi:hypothetical protein